MWAWLKLHPQRITSVLAGLIAFLQGYAGVVTKILGANGMEYTLASVAFVMFILAQIKANSDV